MKAGEGHDSNVGAINQTTATTRVRKWDRSELNTGLDLVQQQLVGQIRKRWLGVVRSKWFTLAQVVVPAFILFLTLVSSMNKANNTAMVQRELVVADYPSSSVQSVLHWAG